MACADPLLQIDDESFALQLQLQELDDQRERQTGKWTEDNPPDFALAFDDFQAELMKLASLVEDVKLAHSIAKAVDSDATAIEELRAEEAQSIQDRGFALSLNEDGNLPSRNATDVPDLSGVSADSTGWDHVLRAMEASTLSVYSDSTVAGPSTQYAERQRAVFEQLPQLKVECTICGESAYPHNTVRLACNDVYCKPCLKEFFMRVTKDETLFPPKCHRNPIHISLIEAEFSVEELAAYRSAELEFSSTNRLYCADPKCAAFIPLPQRAKDHASCEVCGTTTCVHCKALAHEGGCPEDEARQSLVHFADVQGWKACFGCGEMVYRYEGCNHMTCRCSAEFCYRCGVKWKQCDCGDWEVELLDQRAQRIVDREAPWLDPDARRQRIAVMAEELRANHECTHSGKFRKIAGGPTRRGYACEICGARHWKYILSCRLCHMQACEDCRRHRV